eukprot:scaffold20479_cov217-Skeletonema_menzelii.AAC.2
MERQIELWHIRCSKGAGATYFYAVDQFIVRWRQISLLKCGSSDWKLYAVVNDDSGGKDKQSMPAQLIASFASRPEYEEIDAALKGVVKK